jgi:flagellar motor switch protein FliM
VLDQQLMSLQDVLEFKVGTRLMLNATPSSPVELRCGDERMFVGQMGRKGGNVAVCIDRRLTREEATQ